MSALPFIGRSRQLQHLLAISTRVGQGESAAAFLSGPPGVGKSSLAQQLLVGLAERGWRTAAAGAWEFGGAPPFRPWIELLRQLGADDAARDLSVRADDVTPSRDARAAVLIRVGEAIGGLAGAGAALLLDDLHAADAATLALLRFVVQHQRPPRLLVLGTWRSVEHDASPATLDALAEIARYGEVLDVASFDRDELAQLLVAVARVASATAIERLAAATGGLPLLACEVARSGVEGTVPSGARAWLERRLARLGPETRAVLAWVALLGRPAAPRFLAHASGFADDAVMRALDEAHEHRLVDVGGRPPEVTLAHGLVRETLVGGLKPSERAAMHARLADALEALYRVTDVGPHLAELAHHHVAGASHIGHARAAEVVARSGEEALARLAFEDARTAYATAIRLALSAPDATRPAGSIAGWRARLGECAWLMGDRASAVEAFRLAVTEARQGGEVAPLVRAVLAWGRTVEYLGRDPEVEAALSDALERLPEDALEARVDVATMLAVRLWTAPGAGERRHTLIALAEQAARALGIRGASRAC